MKKKKKIGIILISIILIIIIIIIFSYCKYQEKQEQLRLVKENQEQNYLFTHDVIRSLIYIEKALKADEIKDFIEEDAEYQFLTSVYSTKENLLNAKKEMEKWDNSKNIKINEIASDMLDGINDLIISTEATIRIAERTAISEKQDLAIFQIKLEGGKKKIMIAPLKIDSSFSLSDIQKIELIFYIEENFKEAVEERKKQETIGEEPTMRAPVVAAFLIKGILEGVGTDWNKIKEGF